MSRTTTHRTQVLHHLKSGKSITPTEALDLFGCFRLGARIFELREEGHPIEKQMVEVTTRTGDTTRVAEYWLAA